MKRIDLQRIRESLPDRAIVDLRKSLKNGKTTMYIICKVPEPSLNDSDFQMVKDWQRDIIGLDAFSEFYTEETGRHWLIYLKRIPIEFENVSDNDASNVIADSFNFKE